MILLRNWLFYSLLLVLGVSSLPLQAFGGDEAAVQVSLISEERSIQPGRPFWLAVHFELKRGWHIYWKNPGEAGLPTELFWDLPDGMEVLQTLWPAPERYETNGMVGYGYEGPFDVLVQIQPSERIPVSQPAALAADLSWVACHESCVPGDQQVSLKLTVDNDPPNRDLIHRSLFASARARLPSPLSEVTATVSGPEVFLTWHGLKGADEAYFFAEEPFLIDLHQKQNLVHGSEQTHLRVVAESGDVDWPHEIAGILLVKEQGKAQAYSFTIPLGAESPTPVEAEMAAVLQAPSEGGENASGGFALISAMLAALVGGLILNLMPCVLPVISLKVLGFVKMAGDDRRTSFLHGLVFSIGVLVSFWALASVLLILQASGEAVGWGFQLQEPGFVVVLTFVLFLVGLNFFGVFEIGLSLPAKLGGGRSDSHGLLGSFSSGILATALATPCTGPFLGPAIGFAATQGPIASLAIFTFMGVGMASPYLLLAAFPSLLKFLPKPGNWMIAFKQSMGFVMWAAVIWLLWVLSALTGESSVFLMLGYLLLAGLGMWIYGSWGTPMQKPRVRHTATVLTVLCLAVAGWKAIELTGQDPAPSTRLGRGDSDGVWEYFSVDRLQELQAEGRPVFVDFTAKWCLICQANKLAMFDTVVNQRFKEKGVVAMEADWTRRDPAITKFLAEHGRNGVPLYLLYGKDTAQAPKVLPQTLTPDIILECLDNL